MTKMYGNHTVYCGSFYKGFDEKVRFVIGGGGGGRYLVSSLGKKCKFSLHVCPISQRLVSHIVSLVKTNSSRSSGRVRGGGQET